jgi:hypothetical protein
MDTLTLPNKALLAGPELFGTRRNSHGWDLTDTSHLDQIEAARAPYADQLFDAVPMLAGRAVGATGAYRVDFRYNKSTQHVVALEINTLPGMTPTSLLPDAAAASGKSYTALVRWMMEDGLHQWSLKRAPKT